MGGAPFQYSPRLTGLPILLGTSLNVTQYGQPVRATPNGGSIQFRIDASIWNWTAYRWIGRPFRVYEGSPRDPLVPVADVDTDMTLVYVGRHRESDASENSKLAQASLWTDTEDPLGDTRYIDI